jgi:hypothetical protein
MDSYRHGKSLSPMISPAVPMAIFLLPSLQASADDIIVDLNT